MNSLSKSVLTAVHGADSGAVLGVHHHLCWQTGFLQAELEANRLPEPHHLPQMLSYH